ncbi:DUF421 domain-containing protein [Paenibacillus sp. YN15]|uniref:DUF421 domain-containing protein n=1 Tax=Paenibacillus sp. YN15 TaxID=1742774 RepID=UPI000DCEB077|nr:YetF domain-containing protein [Paenibacillus sp. YN15]RAV02331.1 DUF421 domain-containing protein [Paenibacillus sp. YN15]
MEYLQILAKLAAGFLGLWAMTRILGKKEISALTPFDFVSAVILGDLVGSTIYEESLTILQLLVALAGWTILSICFDKLTQYVKAFRKPLEGKPDLLICDGKIDVQELYRNNLDFDQLRTMLRSKDIFSLSEVAFAVYETNGTLSVMRKSSYETVSRRDLGLPDEPAVLPRGVIENGKRCRKELEEAGLGEEWLLEELEKQGITDIKAIAYAELTPDGELHIIRRM